MGKMAITNTSFRGDFVTAFLVEVGLFDEQIVNAYLIEKDLKSYKEAMDSINSSF